jgi:small subunit ribosomal protein S21
MVREGKGGHPELARALGQPVDPAGPVEQAVVRVDMKVDEILVGGSTRGLTKISFRDAQAGTGGKPPCLPLLTVDGGAPAWPISRLFPRESPQTMSIEIKIRKNEPIDRALRRMKKKLDRENIIKGTRAKRYYEKPCEKRRRKEKVMAFTAMLRRRYDS